VVPRGEWLAAREALLVKEKEAIRARDALNAERRQLIVYHFMFDPSWDEGCPGCSMVVDNMGDPAHLHARGVSRVLISRAPLSRIGPFKKRMGWTEPWYSSFGSDLNSCRVEPTGRRPCRPFTAPTAGCAHELRRGPARVGYRRRTARR